MQIPKIVTKPVNTLITNSKPKALSHVVSDGSSFMHNITAPMYSLKTEQVQPLKVFEGMTKKEIDFILNDLHVISTGRGCSHRCTHCYVSAIPAGKNSETFVSKLPYEDFESLMKSLADLRQRGSEIKHDKFQYTAMFYDSDCMELMLKDRAGKEHDFIDLHKLFYESAGVKTIFDTAGWNPRSQRLQERAERYVEYLTKNNDKFYQINLSMNPFNILYQKSLDFGYDLNKYSVLHLDQPPKDLGEKAYRLFIDQMANMLYTFTPLIKKDNFGVIIRAADETLRNMGPYNALTFKQIRTHIIGRLYQMYAKDLQTARKYVNSQDQIVCILQKYMDKLGKYDTNLLPAGRYKELLQKRNPEFTEEDFISLYKNLDKSNFNLLKLKYDPSKEFIDKTYMKFINTDGRVYLFDSIHLIPTELQLKISTNGKETLELKPYLVDDFVFTREMINKM